MKTLFRFLLGVLLAGWWLPAAHGQTLGQVLRATQERWNLQEQAHASSRGSGGTPPNPQPIQWVGGVSASPTDAEVNALPVETQIALLRQAGLKVRGMYYYEPPFSGYADSRLVSKGAGLLGTVYIEWPQAVTPQNFAWQSQRLGHLLSHMKTVVWSASWTLAGHTLPTPYSYPPPPPPPPPLTFLGGKLDVETDPFAFPSISTGVSTVLAASFNDGLSALWTSITGLRATAPTGVGGTFDFYSGAHYTHQAVGGLAWPSPARGGPEAVRLSSAPATSGGAIAVDLGSFESVGGDPSSLSLPGNWLNTPYTYTSSDGRSWTQTITQFVPKFTSADLAGAALWANPADASRPYYNGSNPYWGPGQNNSAVDNLYYFSNLYDGPGVAIVDGFGEWYTQTFDFSSYFTADFSKDFSFPASAVPEPLPPLQIVPDLAHGLLKVALANAPASECELMWGVSAATTPCAARWNLSVAGCGDWDAVYSGAATDREPEYQWQGTFNDQNKRWPGFYSYLAEWWQPVLTQLKTATWAVNITQQSRYKYQVDFYYSSQAGAKGATNGRYTFTGSPAESWTVENASADDAATGQIRVTTPAAVYDLAVTAPGADATQWSLTAHDRQGTPAAFLSKNVTLTSNSTSAQSPGTTVVDATSVAGAALPVVTTTYWYLGTPDRIDQITENGGAEGARTTQYTYAPSTELPSNITQTGGANPYSADYDATALLTNYVSGSSQVQLGYNGAVVTRAENFNGAAVRTATTTYSDGMATATTTVNGASGAPAATTQFYAGDDPVYPWGPKLARGFDGTLTTFSYQQDGSGGLIVTQATGRESSAGSGTVAAGTQTTTKINAAGQVYGSETDDIESGLALDSATATRYQNGTPFPSQFSRPLGTTESFSYDGVGRVLSQTDRLGMTTTYTRDALDRPTRAVRGNLTWTASYNPTAGSFGRFITLSAPGQSNRTSDEESSPFGLTRTLTIAGPENVTVTRTEAADASGTVTTQTANGTTHQSSTQTLNKGTLATSITGNASEPWNLAYRVAAGGGWQRTATHGSDGALTATTIYDPLGRVVEEDTPNPNGAGAAAATKYTYANGLLSAAADPAGTTQYTYQPDGAPGGASRGNRFVSISRYAAGGGGKLGWQWQNAAGETLWRRAFTPRSGVTEDYPWGEAARKTTTTPTITGAELDLALAGPNLSGTASWVDGVPSGGTLTSGAAQAGWSAASNPFGDVTSQTLKPGNAAANALTSSFDPLGLPSGTTGLVASTQANTFDGSGGLASAVTRGGHTLTRSLSAKGDDLGTTGYGVPNASVSLPGFGGTVTQTMTTGAGSAQFTRSLAGTLLGRQFPDQSAESFGYDGSGALASWTTPRASFGFLPNAFGQPTQIGGMGTLGYDPAGRVNAVSNASDATTETYQDGQPRVETHTAGVLQGQSVERDYDGLGRLQTLKLPGGVSVTYAYNGAGGALSGVTTASGAAGTWSNFDAATGRAQNFTLGKLSTASAWDGLGRNISQSSMAAGATWAYTSRQYDADGHCKYVNTPDGAWTYGYDGKGWLHTAQGPRSLTYNFDEAGRPPNATDFRPTARANLSGVTVFGTVTPEARLTVNNQAVPVDPATGRFSLSLAPVVPAGWQTYTTRGTLAGAGANGAAAVAESVNQVFVPPASEALGYDASGNRQGDARWTQTWNALDQLSTMAEASPFSAATKTQVDCLYDLAGRRVQKQVSVGGAVTRRTTTLWDGWKPVMEVDYTGAGGAETARRYYTWGPDAGGSLDGAAGVGGLLEVLEKKGTTATTSLPIYDGVGNVVGLVDGATGQRVATYQYGPFGEVLGVYGPRAAGCPFRFQTRLYDDETGLSYFGKRYYDAKTQTWLSRDPLREGGGVNLYAYCGNDPVTERDPVGLATLEQVRRKAEADYLHAMDYGTAEEQQAAEAAMSVQPNDPRLTPPSPAQTIVSGLVGALAPGPSDLDRALSPTQPTGSGLGHELGLHGLSFLNSAAGFLSTANDPTRLFTGEQSISARGFDEAYRRRFTYGERSAADFNLLIGSFIPPEAANQVGQLAEGAVGILQSLDFSLPGPRWNPLNYRVPAGELYSGIPRLVYRGPTTGTLTRGQAQARLIQSLGQNPYGSLGQAHHIFDFVDHSSPLGQRLQGWGIDLNSVENGVFLPNKANLDLFATIHSGRSSMSYRTYVQMMLGTANSPDEASAILRFLKNELQSGFLPINGATGQ